MRRLILAIMLAAGCAQPAPAPLSDSDAEAVRAASREYTQLARDTAWAAWGEIFTEDAAFLPPNAPALEGRSAIEAWVRTFPPLKDLRIEPSEVIGSGDLAVARGRYHMVIAAPNQPELPDSGKYIEVWRKQADGRWKVFRDIFNSDIPLPAPAAQEASAKK